MGKSDDGSDVLFSDIFSFWTISTKSVNFSTTINLIIPMLKAIHNTYFCFNLLPKIIIPNDKLTQEKKMIERFFTNTLSSFRVNVQLWLFVHSTFMTK